KIGQEWRGVRLAEQAGGQLRLIMLGMEESHRVSACWNAGEHDNWQSGALVLGAEDDFDWSNLKGSISAQCGICGSVTNASLEHDIDWFGTARARIGYAADGWLAYATGGYAFGRVALKGTATGGGVSASLTQNTTPSGWTIGGGAELALGPNWSARLEYLYVDLGTVNNTVVVTGAPSLTDSARIQMNVVRAGVNYRF
ncbi:MAG: outer membrane protein, partial [Xanthobacteraceae bacterium]